MDILSFIRERAGDYDCPVCRDPLVDCGLRLLRQDGTVFTVEVSCARCNVTFVVVLQLRGDLSSLRARPVRATAETPPAAPPISADEMLDVHERLRDRSGTLAELLGESPDRARVT